VQVFPSTSKPIDLTDRPEFSDPDTLARQDFTARFIFEIFGREQALDHHESFGWGYWLFPCDGKSQLSARKSRNRLYTHLFEISAKPPDTAFRSPP
jgi:hypothetical protein